MKFPSLEEAFIDSTSTMRLVVVPATTDTVIAGPHERRIAIRIWGTNGLVYIANTAMTSTNQGFTVNTSLQAQITQWTDGDMATKEWHAYTAGATNNVVVEEVFTHCPCATGHGHAF